MSNKYNNTLEKRLVYSNFNYRKRLAKKCREKAQKANEYFELLRLAKSRILLCSDIGNIYPETLIDENELSSYERKRLYNEVYSYYYYLLHSETNLLKYLRIGDSVAHCYDYFFGDFYGLQRTFDVKNIQLCHNRFCVNCNHLRQASKLTRFTSVLNELRKDYDVYHLVLTVPNCTGDKLSATLDKFYSASRKLLNYFSGKHKLAGIDFSQYGYGGAVRCLEIVVNSGDNYHPHFHILLLLKKGLALEKNNVNKFSFKYGVFTRSFSDFEVLLQKIMYVAMNENKVTLESIDNVPLGYSCTLDIYNGDEWHECFKYVTKVDKKESSILDYEQFKTVLFALQNDKGNSRRIMQGFGKLYNVGNDDSIDMSAAEEYYNIIARLQLVESPKEFSYNFDDLMYGVEQDHLKVISRAKIRKAYSELKADE